MSMHLAGSGSAVTYIAEPSLTLGQLYLFDAPWDIGN
jgi:hypothetical protein